MIDNTKHSGPPADAGVKKGGEMKYRKKPVVIEATQFTQEMLEAHLWDGGTLPEGLYIGSVSHNPTSRKVWYVTAKIDTLEGRMEASIGDYIITGVKGERYACKPDIFEMTYEPVVENPDLLEVPK